MNRKELMSMLNNPYLRYTQHDLALELEFLFNKESHPQASPTIRMEASNKRAQVYEMISIFEMIKDLRDSQGNPFDLSKETAATILTSMTGKPIHQLKNSMGTAAANGLNDAVSVGMSWLRKGAKSTGSALIKFGNK